MTGANATLIVMLIISGLDPDGGHRPDRAQRLRGFPAGFWMLQGLSQER
jgi:hypothetical protein